MTLVTDLTFVQGILTGYVLSICYVMGIIGCVCNLMVFHQRKLHRSSCSVYFIATSVFNLLVIICGMTPVLLAFYLPEDPTMRYSALCKARSYTTHAFLMMSRSSVILTCVDRAAVCSQNTIIRSVRRRHLAVTGITSVAILWLVVPIHILIYVDIQPLRRCGAAGSYQMFYTAYAAVVATIPLIVMVIFSSWAAQSLRQARIRVRPVASDLATENLHSRRTRVKKRDVQLLTILISEVVVYVLSTVWFPVITIYTSVTSNVLKSSERVAIEGFARYLALSFLIFLNSCSIFYVHLLASRTFRQECRQLFLHLFRRNPNRSEPHVARH